MRTGEILVYWLQSSVFRFVSGAMRAALLPTQHLLRRSAWAETNEPTSLAAVTAATAGAALRSGAVFTAAVMSSIAYMALPVPCLIRMEVVERLLPALRHRTSVAMTRVIA